MSERKSPVTYGNPGRNEIMTTYVCKVYAFRGNEGRAGAKVTTSQSREIKETERDGFAFVILDDEISKKAQIYVNGAEVFSDYCSQFPETLPVPIWSCHSVAPEYNLCGRIILFSILIMAQQIDDDLELIEFKFRGVTYRVWDTVSTDTIDPERPEPIDWTTYYPAIEVTWKIQSIFMAKKEGELRVFVSVPERKMGVPARVHQIRKI